MKSVKRLLLTIDGPRRLDVLMLAFILLCGIKFLLNIERVLDIFMGDESWSLQAGMELPSVGLRDPSWSPLYSLWYYLLSLFEPDGVRLYYLNYKILVMLVAALFYVFLRSLKTNHFISAVATVWLMLSTVTSTWPYNGLFAIAMVLTCLNLTVRIASEETSFLLLGVCVAGVIFVRPEFLMSLILVMGWLLIYYWRNRRGIGLASAAKLGLFLGGLIVLFRVFGNPLEGEGKFWPAFGQHFSINYIQWHRAPMVAWFDWREIVRATFGDVTSIWAAAVNNSGAFARHIASNVGTYALATILEPMIAPLASLAPRVHGAVAILQLGILTGSGLVLMRALSRDRRLVVGAFPRRLVVAAVALIASNVAAGLLYYPRWHYLVVQTVLLLAGIAALLSAAVDRAARIPSLREAMGFGLALVLLTPNADWGWLPPGGEGDQWSRDSSLPRWSLERERQYAARRFAWTFPSSAVFWSYWTGGPLVASWQAEAVVPAGILENRAFIAAARSLRIDDPVNLLAFLPPYRAYLGPNYRDVEDQELYSSFLEFLRAKEVNMIFVNDKLMRSRKWSQDREFTQFLKDPATHGFRAIEIPSRDSWLLVRKGLE